MSKHRRTPTEPVTELIRRMVDRIVARFQPEQVILFGSYARGQTGPDSDVDLLVVVSGTDSTRETCLRIRKALHDIRVPKDIVVDRPEEFAWRKEIVGTIEYPAAREGKLLYAKA